MKRRTVLALGLAALGGCLGESSPPAKDTVDRDRTEDRHTDAETDTPIPPDAKIVAYGDLSQAGRRFVDDAQDRGHNLDWLSNDGERTYVRYDRETERYVRVDDPLTLDDVDAALERVFRGDALVEREGRLYEGGTTVGHGPYKNRYEAVADPDCDEAVVAGDLSEPGREIAGVLAEDGEAWVSTRKFERVADADVFVADEEAIGRFAEAVGIPSKDGGCVDVKGRRLRVTHAEQASLNHRGYTLEFVRDAA